MFRSNDTSTQTFGRGARALVALLAALLVTGGLVAGDLAPAAAAGPAKDGLSAETASPSCWAIKQAYPASADGTYWLRTPKLVAPEQFYCDMTTSGGGWVLVGRGREGWTFSNNGQRTAEDVRTTITGPDAFAPAALSTATIDGLLNGGRMDGLTDGIRLRRATNPTGTTWQEARLRVKTFGSWSWAMGGGIYLSSVTFDGNTTNLGSSNYRTNTTANVQVSNDTRRVLTYNQQSHNYKTGFGFGNNVSNGSNNSTSYLWEYSNENQAIPFTQVFLRPQISEAAIVSEGVSYAPDGGLAGSTVPKMLDSVPVAEPWGVTGLNVGLGTPIRANVLAFAEIGNTIYVGGKFLQVQHGDGGQKFDQPYLAAFDRDTGEWIPGFNPVVAGPVHEIKAAPDGTKLFVGGEFGSVNGLAGTSALAALDPTTGAPVAGWSGYANRPNTNDYDIRSMDIDGPWLYVGGNFTRVWGGVGNTAISNMGLGRLARFRLTDGRPDPNWRPLLNTAPQDLDVSAQGDRVYAVGSFTTLNNVTLDPTRLAIMDTTTGAAVPGLQGFKPNVVNGEWQNAILEVGDKVYQGGSQHFLHQYNRADYAFERSHMTKNGGDFQAIAYHDGIVYGSCHCTNWQYQDANTWSDPAGYSRVDPMQFIGAYDATQNLEVLPSFEPEIFMSGDAGPWEMMFDSQECMWVGGDVQRRGSTELYGGYERLCQRDTTAPSTPPNASGSVLGNTVNLTWDASSDNSGKPLTYEILKDDPTFGTVVVGTTPTRTFSDPGETEPGRYFVRAVDKTGNRSATTSVITVTPPPPAAATLIAHGQSWSYQADGQDLGTAWRQPGFDSSSWSTGSSELGWGDGDEATVVPSAPITHYFTKHIDVPTPSLYSTLTVRLKRDDGAAVYLNGVEVTRSNLPAGQLSATTPASSAIGGADESTWYEVQIPASLLVTGDNVIGAELHQAGANNPDGTFDLELIARSASEANAPSAPAPSVTNTGFSTADLAWTASADDVAVAGYLIKRNGTPIAYTAALTYRDSGLEPTTAYTYQVIAVDSSGNESAPGTVGTTTGQNPVVVGAGAVWSYRSGAPDSSTAWKNPGYDVSSWPTGPAQLGWGDGDEATVVPNGTVTQYYVRHFSVDDPAEYQALKLRLVRDDGAAVYLNGVEIARSNLPTGTLTPTTFAPTGLFGAAESAWNEFTVPGSLLSTGDNVIAVEVHQNSNNNGDSSFDLELLRTTPAETTPPSRPELTLTDATGSAISFSWTASTDNTGVLGYIVRRDGAVVGYTSGTSFTDTGLAGSSVYGYQVTAVDGSGNVSTPGSLAASTTVNPWLVDFGSPWKYRNDGVDQGSAWRTGGFDDSAWSSGASELGYGDNDEATVIGPAVNPTPITAYFRSSFNVTDPNTITALSMDVVRDDGFVAYLNGVEIGRQNMPAGTIAYGTRPSSGIGNRTDETTPVTLTVPPSALQAGVNTIAVEMHNSGASTDLSFNLRLRATYGTVPVVTITSPAEGGAVTTPTTTLAGLCTGAAGTVTVNVAGTAPAILTAPCVANEWTAAAPLVDGAYTAVASQTDGVTGSSPVRTFSVDTVAPVVTIDAPADGVLLGVASPTVSGTCTTGDGDVTVTATGAGSAQATASCTTGTFSTTIGPLVSGAYSASAAQTDAATNTGTSAARAFTVDVAAPVTTDDAAATGSAWRTAAATVTLTPTDAGSGVAATYYTIDGNPPTTSSPSGTSIVIDAPGVYTIQYFSVDAFGNAEPVKTAANQIRIDRTAPTGTATFPVNGTAYNATTWAAGCTTAGICGTAADDAAGVQTVELTVQRSSDAQYWNGSGWVAPLSTVNVPGGATWAHALPAAQLTNGVTYTLATRAIDAAGNASAPATTTFVYDTAGPTTSNGNIITTNKNGSIQTNGSDTFAVTFAEPIDPATIPATGTVSFSRSFGSTSYSISGLTSGSATTGGSGYVTFGFSTRTVSYAGTFAVSNSNRTVTFTITGSCTGSCSSVSTSSSSGSFSFTPTSAIRDVAGNSATGTTSVSSTVMF